MPEIKIIPCVPVGAHSPNDCPLLYFYCGSMVKNLLANAGDAGDTNSIPGLGRSPGRGNGNPLQYSCLENPMDRGAWRATVHRVTKSQTQQKPLSSHTDGVR